MNEGIKRNKLKEFFHVEWKSFFTLVKMLLANSLSIDLKNKKKTAISIVSKIVMFVIIAALSYVFFYFCIQLGVFSVLPYVPSTVPSIIINVMLVFSFLGTLFRVTNDLYFANDNKVLLTMPVNGNTLFIARLFVSYMNSFIKSLTLEIPFLLGYFAISKYPVYMFIAIFAVFLVLELFFVLVSALLSIPLYFIKRFLISYPLVQSALILFVTAIVIAGASVLISIIPEKIDIFSNWSPYFARIQNALRFYTINLSFFFQTSKMFLGGYTGYVFQYFGGLGINGLWTFLVILGSLPIIYVLSLSFASPLYLRLASGNDELLPKQSKREKLSSFHKPFISQLKKELLLYAKDSKIASSYTGIFVALPLIMALISKIFMAMDLNSRGLSLAQVAILLIALIISLTTNSMIANIYSLEGGAFKIGRTAPLKDGFKLTSKLFIPGGLGTLSLAVTFITIANLREELFVENLLLGGSVILIYIGHLLYSASLDFTNPKASFGDVSFLSNNENRSIILAFAVSALFSLLFYYFSNDGFTWIGDVRMTSSFKMLLIGILFFGINLVLYIQRIRYVYSGGESL